MTQIYYFENVTVTVAGSPLAHVDLSHHASHAYAVAYPSSDTVLDTVVIVDAQSPRFPRPPIYIQQLLQ